MKKIIVGLCSTNNCPTLNIINLIPQLGRLFLTSVLALHMVNLHMMFACVPYPIFSIHMTPLKTNIRHVIRRKWNSTSGFNSQ